MLMGEFKFHLQATALVLTIMVLCSTLAQNHVPWFLANVATVPFTASDAFIIDAVHNSTHWVVLDSYFRLRYFTYSATTASLVRTVDISSKMGIGIVDHPNLKSQSDRTASLGINPLGDVFVAVIFLF
ncbi:hypothetical protein BKA69DRAFT_1106201 [Paraphysoderma sedebokerense]|nr:hypothetical protein BKA69DRAFT_1106201 [Paraphysoderma sedebokerense]